jgi:hypothetical protein
MPPNVWHVKECPVKMGMKIVISDVPTAPVPTALPLKIFKVNGFRRCSFGFTQVPFSFNIHIYFSFLYSYRSYTIAYLLPLVNWKILYRRTNSAADTFFFRAAARLAAKSIRCPRGH